MMTDDKLKAIHLYCYDFDPTASCCISCHEDHEEYGYDLIGGWIETKVHYIQANICCGVQIDTFPKREVWAEALRTRLNKRRDD